MEVGEMAILHCRGACMFLMDGQGFQVLGKFVIDREPIDVATATWYWLQHSWILFPFMKNLAPPVF